MFNCIANTLALHFKVIHKSEHVEHRLLVHSDIVISSVSISMRLYIYIRVFGNTAICILVLRIIYCFRIQLMTITLFN